MYLSIEGESPRPRFTVVEPEDYTRLHVSAPGVSHDVVGELLHRNGIGRTAPDPRVWLDIAALKALAAAGDDVERTRRFDEMIAFARSKGWVDDTGSYVQAHLHSGEG
jgi:hypothetical protein